MAEASASIELEARLRDFVTSRVQQMRMGFTSSFARMQKSAANFGARMSSMFSSVKSGIIDFAKRFGPAAIAVGALTGALTGISRAIDFVREKSIAFGKEMSRVQAVLGDKAGPEGMKALNDEAQRLGQTTVFSASEAASAFTELAKVGLDANQILATTESVLNVAAASGVELAVAAEAVARTLGQFNLDAVEATRVTDVMARSFSSSALDMNRFVESMKFVGATANSLNISLEETTGALAELANKGILGSQAGTALRRILLELGDAGSKASKIIAQINPEAETFAEKLRALQEANLTPAQIKETFGLLSSTAADILIKGADSVEKFGEAFKNGTLTAKEMADVMLNNVAGASKLLESAQEGLALAVGETFGDAKLKRLNFYQKLITSATAFIQEHQGVLTALANFLSGTFVNTIEAIGRLLVVTFQGTLSAILALVGGAVKGFQKLGDFLNKFGADFDTSSLKTFSDSLLEDAEIAGEKAGNALLSNFENSIFGNTASLEKAAAEAAGKVAGTVSGEESSSTGVLDEKSAEEAKRKQEQFNKEIASLNISFAKQSHESKLALLTQQRDELLQNQFATEEQKGQIIREFDRKINEEKMAKENELFIQEQQMRTLRVAAMEEGMQRELAALDMQKDAELRKFKDNEEAKALIQQKFANQRMKVEKKFSKQKQNQLDREKRANQQLTDSIISDSSRGLQALISNEKQAKKIALITSIIQGVLAVQRAIANPPGFPFNAPQVAATAIKAAANTATIASQSFQEGGFPVGQNALVRVNEAGQEAVLNAGATARLGRGQINNLNAGRGSTTVTNEISYSPTITVAKSTEENVLDVLRNDKEAFAEFVQRDVIDKGFLSLQD